MRRLLLAVLAGRARAAGPAGAASPTVRLAIVHVVSGCHVWATAALRELGPSTTVTVKRGTRIEIRPNCPMDFDFAQVKGPKVALGPARTVRGTLRVLVLRRPGTYVFTATNVQTPEEAGLQTLGPTNTPLRLTVKVT